MDSKEQLTENTIIKFKYLINKNDYVLKGKENIIDDVKDSFNILYDYEDITEKELNYYNKLVSENFDEAMDKLCDVMELDYEYIQE